jgi:probable selenium-dependent hydroxylase accessory protein YqeC
MIDECRNAGCRVITVIGSGGKTSLIWHLAASFAAEPDRKILVTPTTKMLVPPLETRLYHRYLDCRNYNSAEELKSHTVSGITLAGVFNEASGKLESLPPDQLEKIVSAYDSVLIEGDGSRGLPLKAWADDEPVVPPFTDLTIGMLPLWPLGKPVSEKLVHRLPLFLTLTGAVEGEPLKAEHILRLITGDADCPGLFAKARGGKILFFNQIEDDASMKQTRELAESLPPEFRGGLSAVIAGSVRENRFVEM